MREALHRLVNRWRDAGGRPGTGERIAVLAITTDGQTRGSLAEFAVCGGWELVVAASCEEALETWRKSGAVVILCDRDLPGADWREAIQKLAESRTACAILLASAVSDEYLWDEVIHRGGYDVLAKPLQEQQTVRAVNLAWSYAKERARA